MDKEKADMIIYTTEDGLTKVETTFDGEKMCIRDRYRAVQVSHSISREWTSYFTLWRTRYW